MNEQNYILDDFFHRQLKVLNSVCLYAWVYTTLWMLCPSVSDYSLFFFPPVALSDYYRFICRLKGQGVCVCLKNWPLRQTMWLANHYMTCWIPALLHTHMHTHGWIYIHVHMSSHACATEHTHCGDQLCVSGQSQWNWLPVLYTDCVCVSRSVKVLYIMRVSLLLRNLTPLNFPFLHFSCTLSCWHTHTPHNV